MMCHGLTAVRTAWFLHDEIYVGVTNEHVINLCLHGGNLATLQRGNVLNIPCPELAMFNVNVCHFYNTCTCAVGSRAIRRHYKAYCQRIC